MALAERVGNCDAPDLPAAFSRYAAARWQRNARVQARARRNGEVFHASGARRVARLHAGTADWSAWARTVSETRCDMLVYPEIGMHPAALRLACLRLAPV